MCACVIVPRWLVLESSHELHHIIGGQVGDRHDVLSSTDVFIMFRNRLNSSAGVCRRHGTYTLIAVCQAHTALCPVVLS